MRSCKKCVMDETDVEIVFDHKGVCNYCLRLENVLPNYVYTEHEERSNLQEIELRIKKNSVDGKYDCIIGLSGGVDSSFVAHLAKKMGLNALCVHFDNGWNSDTAVSNIKKIVDKCGFDLETYVIDWGEFKDLQRSFIKAGVVDIEMLTDHAIMATMFKLRRKHRVRYVLSGVNIRTENGMPNSWLWRKQDLTNIRSIQAQYGTRKIKEFPTMNSVRLKLAKLFGFGGVYIEILNRINYSKSRAQQILESEYSWEAYGGKHHESIFTKFYQSYILPEKFNIDKRKVHLSSLIRSGEITREQALIELHKPLYNSSELARDKAYVLKKLGFSNNEFDKIMSEAPRHHLDFKSDEWIIQLYLWLMGKNKTS